MNTSDPAHYSSRPTRSRSSQPQADGMQIAGLLARAERTVMGLSPVLTPLAHAFAEHGESLYLVGGSVRDAILGRLGHDLDFTTSARPQVIQEILQGYTTAVWDTGIEFGTVSAEKAGQQIEITTFRADLYDGVTRNPEVTFGDTLEGDLVRRDFAVNAMAIELQVGNTGQLQCRFHDPVGGLDDLLARRLDTPGTPEDSFRDDPLRMLRAARFVSQLGFGVAPRVVEAMTQMAGEIQRITVERVQVELDKLMLGVAPWDGWNLLVRTGLASLVMPEVADLRQASDEHHRHKDVYEHSMTVLRQAMDQEDAPDLVLRWAALLHDCGKPATREFKEGGRVTFHHHEVVGAKLARRRLHALKYPKAIIDDVSQLIFLHMRFYGFSDSNWTDSAVRRYVTDAGPLLPRLHKLTRADVTTRNERKARRMARAYDELEERIAEIQAREDLAQLRPALDGNEIMQVLGLAPGPEVGKAWNFLKEVRLDEGPIAKEEAIARLKSWWADQ